MPFFSMNDAAKSSLNGVYILTGGNQGVMVLSTTSFFAKIPTRAE